MTEIIQRLKERANYGYGENAEALMLEAVEDIEHLQTMRRGFEQLLSEANEDIAQLKLDLEVTVAALKVVRTALNCYARTETMSDTMLNESRRVVSQALKAVQ